MLHMLAWYFFSIISPILNKSVQNRFPNPNTVAVLHLATCTVLGGLSYSMHKDPSTFLPVSYRDSVNKRALPPFTIIIRDLLPLGVAKFMSMVLLLFGLKNLPVSSILTVKALDPIPTAIFTFLLFGEYETCTVYSTVIPIIFGVVLSTTTGEMTASWQWMVVALSLVIVDSAQNVISKSLLRRGNYTENSLQFLSSFIALMVQLPICIYYESAPLSDIIFLKMDTSTIIVIALACTAFYGQVIMAFTVMNQVTNLTYSVANIVKRIAQLLCAVMFFGNTIVTQNAIGMAMAMFGVACYTLVRLRHRHHPRT